MGLRKLLHIGIPACVLLLASLVGLAEPAGDVRDTSTRRDSWALLFQIDSEFNLSPFQGSTVSGKRTFSGGDALRFGTSISAGTTNPGSHSVSVDVSTQYLQYAHTDRDVSFFFGAGPLVGFSHYHSEVTQREEQDGVMVTVDRSHRSTNGYAGVRVVLGVEWLFREHFALSAEYGSSALYSHNRYDRVVRATPEGGEPETLDDSHSTSDGYSFGASGVKLGLTIYL